MFNKLLSYVVDVKNIADPISVFDKVVFLGTGGSSLVGQALKSIAHSTTQDKIIFFDNIDPRTFREKILSLDINKTFFVIISKSGKTSEILTQTLSLVKHLSTNFLIITEKRDSPLMALARFYQWKVLEHPDIGGRFSAFTIVGLLPCILLGLSPQKFIQGANNALQDKKNIEEKIDHIYNNYPTHKQIILSYSDYTNGLLSWMSQLIAESLGKKTIHQKSVGITPIIAKGTVDQHSQLQLWIDGPNDQFFQIYFFNDPFDQSKLSVDFHLQDDALRCLDKLSYNKIFKAHSLATAQTLKNRGYYVEYQEHPILDEEVIGWLMMQKFIEVIKFAALMEINPEDQPGVEQSKKIIGLYL